MDKIAVIGAGSWGTTLAALLAGNGHDVTLWVYEKDLANRISETGINDVFLPGYSLPENLKVSSDIRAVLDNSKYILSVVPSQHTRSVFSTVTECIAKDAVIISASKGIEKGTLLTVSEIFGELTGRNSAVISGPSFAKEVIQKLPTAVTLACEDYGTCLLLQECLLLLSCLLLQDLLYQRKKDFFQSFLMKFF